MLINPGATANPLASISFLPRAPDKSPMYATVSPLIPMSLITPALPDPSYTVPPRITISYSCFLQEDIKPMTIRSKINGFIQFYLSNECIKILKRDQQNCRKDDPDHKKIQCSRRGKIAYDCYN